MLKDSKRRFIRLSIVVVTTLVVIFSAMVLWNWTHAIQTDKNRRELEQVLHTIVEEQGEAGLLSMSGVSVSNIFYGDEGLILFSGKDASWRYSADEMQNISVYEKINRSVVHITTTVEIPVNAFMDVLPAQGTGSGMILSTDGYILTNAHVVEKAASLKVSLYNERS
ncbi:MAG: S1C family serine protease, partial [Sphaerochaeta sp.]